jgi:acyl-CoA reductase-like NAD-dependent aldehyde dehydrogenase
VIGGGPSARGARLAGTTRSLCERRLIRPLGSPFGGFKQSSANTFKEQGPAALELFTRTKTVYVAY